MGQSRRQTAAPGMGKFPESFFLISLGHLSLNCACESAMHRAIASVKSARERFLSRYLIQHGYLFDR
jgi:hypothetical protein